jgi:hypothetical protein
MQKSSENDSKFIEDEGKALQEQEVGSCQMAWKRGSVFKG